MSSGLRWPWPSKIDRQQVWTGLNHWSSSEGLDLAWTIGLVHKPMDLLEHDFIVNPEQPIPLGNPFTAVGPAWPGLPELALAVRLIVNSSHGIHWTNLAG